METSINNLYRPPSGFYFKVSIHDGPKKGGASLAGSAMSALNQMAGNNESSFSEVSGIKVTLNTEDVKLGGEHMVQYKLPTGLSYEPLVLKRGMNVDSELVSWVDKSLRNFKFTTKVVKVKLLGVSDVMMLSKLAGPAASVAAGMGMSVATVLAAWEFLDAYPASWEVSSFNSLDEKNLAIESLTLNYKEFRRLTLNGL